MSPIALCCLMIGQVARGEFAFVPTAAEAQIPALYQLGAATVSFDREHVREEPGYRVSRIRFASPIVSGDPENNTVYADYFQVEEVKRDEAKRRPAVVVLHILGADFALARFVAIRLAQHGTNALFVKLPYYGERRPPGTKFLTPDIERSTLAMRQAVCDVRRAIAWLAAQPENDGERLGVTGISLGGIVSALAAEMEPTVSSAGLLLAGGDLATILWTMPEAEEYRRRWEAAGKTKVELAALVEPFDPLRYAERLKGKRVLMLNASADEVVPPECSRRLWEAAGEPRIEWFDCGHYSAAAYLLPATRKLAEFFAASP
jgi:dienelactone hydrolase